MTFCARAIAVAAVCVAAAAVAIRRAAAAAPVVGQADAEMAKPGKADTFELDTYMRRHKFPLSIALIETEGGEARDVPMTLSVACGEGDYPAGQLTPVLDDRPLAAQVDVLATWPGDRSIKHALVSLVLPAIGAKQRLEIRFRKEAPAPPAKFLPGVDLKGFTARTEFESPKGERTTSAVPPETMEKIGKALSGELPPEEAKAMAPRMCGPLCYEFEVLCPAETGGKPDPDMDVRYYLRFYGGQKGVRVAYVVENTRLPRKPYPKDMVLTDRAFRKLVFQAGPQGIVKTLYEQGPVTHWYGTRYQVLRWWGEKPPSIYTKENLGYLVYSQFFPKLDLDHPMTAKQIEGASTQRVTTRPWYGGPAEHPDGVPLSNGPVYPYMGATGGRSEIGLLPYWYRLALASESPVLEYYARCADGNGLAAFPVHLRPAENQQPGAVYDDPIWELLYWARVKHFMVDNKRCPNSGDNGHVPDASYYTYLATGEKFYEEEMAFWAAYLVRRTKGFLPGHDRYAAWPLRNATNAAFALPDAHPMKKYLSDCVERSVAYQAQAIKDPLSYWNRGPYPGWVCSNHFPLWMHVFYVSALDNAARKGFYPAAAEARDEAADLVLRMYECNEEFKAPDGKTYRSRPEFAIPYTMATDIRRFDCTDPKKIKTTATKTITDNTGAVYYYTMLNEQWGEYQHHKSPEEIQALWAKLPKKVMGPEEWQLDPEYLKRQEEKLTQLRNPGYHEEANGATSAALARYDNPRAQKMYEIVRGFIEKARGPNRVRGVEYVK